MRWATFRCGVVGLALVCVAWVARLATDGDLRLMTERAYYSRLLLMMVGAYGLVPVGGILSIAALFQTDRFGMFAAFIAICLALLFMAPLILRSFRLASRYWRFSRRWLRSPCSLTCRRGILGTERQNDRLPPADMSPCHPVYCRSSPCPLVWDFPPHANGIALMNTREISRLVLVLTVFGGLSCNRCPPTETAGDGVEETAKPENHALIEATGGTSPTATPQTDAGPAPGSPLDKLVASLIRRGDDALGQSNPNVLCAIGSISSRACTPPRAKISRGNSKQPLANNRLATTSTLIA